MTYIDGFVTAVPTANRDAFIEHARAADPIMIECGALRVVDAWGDDVNHGTTTDFYRAVQATVAETVVFSWVEWPDKATRDAGMAHMMSDERMKAISMPFDGKRMIYGGFETVFEHRA